MERVYISTTLEIFERIRKINLQRGFSCEAEDYFFLYHGKRTTSQDIDKKSGCYCMELRFVKKGNHKATKVCKKCDKYGFLTTFIAITSTAEDWTNPQRL